MKLVYFLLSIFIIVSITFLNFDNDKVFDEIVTFIAILVGFSITSLTIIANSQFSKHLIHLDDADNNSKSLLHNLLDKFKWSTLIFILTVAAIFIYNFIGTNIQFVSHHLCGYTFSFKGLLNAIVWYLTLWSFIKFIQLFKMIRQFVIQSAKGK
jgi:hypothetical protein